MKSNTKTMINVFCSLMVLGTNIIVNFFLSPYIVKNIGVEANGFVRLASNFVTYAQLIVTALNSMAARFITIAYVKKDYKKANLYYNSVFWGNLIIVAVLIVPAIVCIYKLDNILNIPSNLVFDVKVLFTFIFLNFFITTGLPNWDCGTFATNRLDKAYIPQVIAAVIRCIILFVAFAIFIPKVYYVGIVATITTLFQLIYNAINTHRLTPELKINLKRSSIICSKVAIKDLVFSGIWNSITNVGNILITGIDLIICNIFIGANAMGIISLSKLLQSYIQKLSLAIRSAFVPELTINYAKEDKKNILKEIERVMKLTSIIMIIPVAIIIVLGKPFFSLWVPTQDAALLQTLSVLSIVDYIFISGTAILYNMFSIVNKVKQNSIVTILTGIISILITVLIIKTTNLGIYAVAGVSTICNLVRNMIFTLPFSAKCLGFKWSIFYKQVFTTMLASALVISVGYLLTKNITIQSWIAFIFATIIIGIVGLIINILVILNKEERKGLIEKIRKISKKN